MSPDRTTVERCDRKRTDRVGVTSPICPPAQADTSHFFAGVTTCPAARRQKLSDDGRLDVRAMIAVENAPCDESWIDLCGREGIALAWPEVLTQAIGLQVPAAHLTTVSSGFRIAAGVFMRPAGIEPATSRSGGARSIP